MTPSLGFALLAAAPFANAQPDYGLDFVTIGDAGNPGWDREDPTREFGGRGAVGYEYRITQTEIDTGNWIEFLNTFSTQSNDLAAFLDTPQRWGGIVDGSYTGSGRRYMLNPGLANPERAFIRVSWRQASYYINWLNNDKSSDPSAILNGAYDVSTYGTVDGGPFFTDQAAHNPDARFWIPTIDEWTKAGHWDPNKNGPGDGGWWLYNHGSDEAPRTGLPGEPGAETSAVDFRDGDPSAELLSQLLVVPTQSYPETRSPWGLIDMTGGSSEWFEEYSFLPPTARTFSGGRAGGSTDADLPYFIDGIAPVFEANSFRVASIVPAPGTAVVLIASVIGTLSRRRRL